MLVTEQNHQFFSYFVMCYGIYYKYHNWRGNFVVLSHDNLERDLASIRLHSCVCDS